MSLYMGVDVSSWQGKIDFRKVRNAGIQLIYIKASEGTNYIDPFFMENYENAKHEGLLVGFYHYLTAKSEEEAAAEAAFFADVIGGLEADMLLAVDLGNKDALTAEEFSRLADVFLENVKRLTGVDGVIYASSSTAKYDLLEYLTKYPLWVAEYGVRRPSDNGKWTDFAGWQYSNMGKVNGIDGNVDFDRFDESIIIRPTVIPDGGKRSSLRTGRKTYYIVEQGDTLSGIARRYGVTVNELARANAISDPDRIYAGQVLRIYTSFGTANENACASYVVRRGDTLSAIARRFGTSVSDIVAANELKDPDEIYPGEVIKLPCSSYSGAGNPSRALDGTFKVGEGDTLLSVANRFKTTPRRMALLNGIKEGEIIHPGQILKVYGSPVSESADRFNGAYIVRRGDTLFSIARRFKTTVDKLVTDNGIQNRNLIYDGQVLYIS